MWKEGSMPRNKVAREKQRRMDIFGRLVTAGVLALLGASIGSLSAVAADVHAQFDLADPAIGPFPSDQFTVADSSQITSRRVTLPKPDCTKQPSDCEDIAIINTLDGFNLQPRITISFDGPINPSSVTSRSVSLVQFGSPDPPRMIGINQVVWDPATRTLYMNSDEALDQHAQFALIATQGILDTFGKPVQASAEFTQFLTSGTGDYSSRVRAGIDAAVSRGIARESIVAASAFTTMSATAILEKIRDQIHAAVPQPATFVTSGVPTVFARSAVSSITIHQQTRVAPPAYLDTAINMSLFDAVPGSVGRIAFGTYVSPNYETPQKVIPQVGTLTGNPAVQGTNTVAFTLVLPAGTQPPSGWPVAIFGHGNSGFKEQAYNFASILAKHGIATIAITGAGWGYGPLGTTDVKLNSGETTTFSAGGRAVDMDGNNTITVNEGSTTFGSPYALITNRDGLLQTIADLMQLVRVIQVGMDVEGDGRMDIDASRIYYFGVSLGGVYGVPFLAVEPGIRAGSPQFAGSSRTDWLRIGANRVLQTGLLTSRIPSLINSPGITQIGGLPVVAPYFNENKPLRNLPPVINDVAGAMDIQRVLDYEIWINQPADAAAFSPHLRKTPLPGMTAKPVLFLVAKADQTVGVPAQTTLLRAGDLADVTTNFRFDLAYAQNPGIPTRNPHLFNTSIDIPSLAAAATGAQEQAATFFETNGARIIHPDPADLFEVPILLPLSENLEYATAGPPVQPPVDSSTYQTALSPGSIFTIFGQTNSVGSDQTAASGNLPTTLGGVMVSINGKPAPLFYVGSNQINGQVPYETAATGAIAQVIANGISAAQVPFAVSPAAPRLFSGQGNVCIALNEDGTLNAVSNPAKAGHYIGVEVIGLGAVNPSVPTGAPARAVPLSTSPGPVSVSLGGRRLSPAFVGLIPAYVGVGQVDLLVPSDLTAGLQDFSVTVANATSNTCQIAVGK